MIVASSAIVAILLQEPGYEPLMDSLSHAEAPQIGAPTLLETTLVLVNKLGLPGRTLLARFVHEAEIDIVPFTEEHWAAAADAFVRYGKGRHPAGLNFGACLTYAMSKVSDEPLLYVGKDFGQTDVRLVR